MHESSPRASDAAIVLGAAVQGDIPSPVFRERIEQAIRLYKVGTVRNLIFTGGSSCPRNNHVYGIYTEGLELGGKLEGEEPTYN
ncbi:vancomycin permeability regulator SanA [Paenibacillus sp. 4624]|jgi:vancomycin permeability regulator SanA